MIEKGFALDRDLECYAVHDVIGETAWCRHASESGMDLKPIPVAYLVQLNEKTIEEARKHINGKISKLNVKLHWMADCESYL